MPVSYKKAIAWGKRKFAEGYASGRRNRIQWSDLAAPVAEIINFDRCIMKLIQAEVEVTGKISVFYVPCGECGNPLAVKETGKAAIYFECAACGAGFETDRLPFTETCCITMFANDLQPIGDNDDSAN